MQLATIVNRTNTKLQGMWDGRIYVLEPKSKHAFPMAVCEAIKRQNPIMGTEDPYNLQMLYKVGIVEQGDDVSDIDLKDFAPAIERFDRKKLVGAKPTEIVAGSAGMYRPEGGLPADGGFTKA